MKTFPSYDYTLCDNKECSKKDKCKRYLTWLKCLQEKYPYPVAVNIPSKCECQIYIEAK